MQPVAFSHFCVVTSIGAGQTATRASLEEGVSGLRRSNSGLAPPSVHVGELAGLDEWRLEGEWAGFDCRNNRAVAMTLNQDGFLDAVAEARERYGAERIGVFLGTSTSGILQTEIAYAQRDPQTGALPAHLDYDRTHNTYSLGAFVRRYLRLGGPSVVVSSACATTAKVFGNAARMMAVGLCDAAVVGGADTLCGTTLHGFRSLNLVSEEPCRPFDAERQGISIGEGAGFALLEKVADRQERGAAVHLLGIGESSDAHHMSSPHPEGIGARLAMERALAAAGLLPRDIDYINLHATATPVGDAAEDRAVAELLGPTTPCSSTKGFTGHTLGASGIIEAIFSALGIIHGFMPGSPHTRSVDPSFRSRYLLERRRTGVDRVLSNSFGFGGANCSLIFGRAG